MKKLLLPISIFAVIGSAFLLQSYAGGITQNSAFHYAMTVKGKSSQISSTAQSCYICHGGNSSAAPDLANEGGLTFDFSGGTSYNADETYNLNLTIDANNTRHGYELIALDTALNGVGTFTTTTGSSGTGTYMVDGSSVMYPYAKHDQGFSSSTFNTTWKAPTAYQGPVTFYAISVSANGNSAVSGDAVFYDKLEVTSNNVSISEYDAHNFFNIESAQGEIRFNTELDNSSYSVEIYDVLGKTAIKKEVSGSTFSMPVNNTNNIVFIKISSEGKVYTTKLKI